MNDDLIATYRFSRDGWSYIYELYSDRIVVFSSKGIVRQENQFDLKLASPFYRRGVNTERIDYPRIGNAAAIAFVAVSIVLYLTLVPRLGKEDDLQVYVTLAWVLGCFGVYWLLPRLFYRNIIYKYLVLRKADGNDLYSLTSSTSKEPDNFDRFADEVVKLIQPTQPTRPSAPNDQFFDPSKK
jgi:hypothetical protein